MPLRSIRNFCQRSDLEGARRPDWPFTRHFSVISSEFILSELREKLTDKFKYSKQDADDVVRHIQTRIEIVFPDDPVESVCRDPDDDHILAAAVTGNCDYVITGDKDLLLLHSYNNIRIFSPAEFQKFEDSLKPE